MAEVLFGGVEGGASVSSVVLIDATGKRLSEASGPGTNYLIIGMEEARKRIANLIKVALSKQNKKNITIKCLCLSLSGAEQEGGNDEFKRGFFKDYPNLAESYFICSDTDAPLASVKEDGGVVLIAGTGSNALVVNPDGSKFHCGGWGYMLGDEGSAFWIAKKALKIYFDHIDNFEEVPYGYNIDILWDTIRSFFHIENRLEILPTLYKNFDKCHFAKLCKDLAEKAKEGDLLCRWLFEQAGDKLAQHLSAVSHEADPRLLSAEGGLFVVCVGSVWKSWELLKNGFMRKFKDDPGKIKEFSLTVLSTSAAIGAAYMAAKKAGYDFPIDYTSNYRQFYHFKLCD